MLEWRLKAYRRWLEMKEPHHWANIYLSADRLPGRHLLLGAQDQEAARQPGRGRSGAAQDLREAGHLAERAEAAGGRGGGCDLRQRLVATTFKETLAKQGMIFCSFSEAVREHPELVQKYLGSVVPYNDNFFAALNSAVFSDGSFVYVPKGVRCPMELSTYFRINTADAGQFERTLIVADEGASVSYLEGCTAPKRDTNQLHAAVVELIALEGATIKYSTVQNWYAGDAEGKGGIYNFVTKRGKAAAEREDFLDPGRDRIGDHLEVSRA